MIEKSESACIENMKSRQFTKSREFDMGKLCLCEDPDKKCEIIVGRHAHQKKGLDILSSAQKFNVIRIPQAW